MGLNLSQMETDTANRLRGDRLQIKCATSSPSNSPLCLLSHGKCSSFSLFGENSGETVSQTSVRKNPSGLLMLAGESHCKKKKGQQVILYLVLDSSLFHDIF